MSFPSRIRSEGFVLSVGTGILVAMISGTSALWFSRSYYFNANRVGWGDASADRSQTMFWWGAVISAGISLLLASITATRSKRFRIALAAAGTLTAALMFVSQRPSLSYMSRALLLPGLFGWILAFGVHADLRKWAGLLWVFGINTVFYAAIVGGVLSALNGRKRLHDKAKS